MLIHLKSGKPSRSTTAFFAATLIASFGLSGCGGSDQPESLPTSSSAATTTAAATSATPQRDPDGWRDQYTPEQLSAYDQALARFTAYETQSEPLAAAGKATPAAEEFFKAYFPSPLWQTYYQQLQKYEASGITMTGLPTVLWSEAQKISEDGRTVTIKQCVDFTSADTYQNGQATVRNRAFLKPLIRSVELDRPAGYNWLIYTIGGPTTTNHQRCTRDAP